MKMTQKAALYSAVIAVLTEAGVEMEGGALNVHFAPGAPKGKEFRGQVNQILFEGFRAGNINYDGTLPNDTELKAYVSGLQSNWLRKDKELNGGVKYTAKNPGSRAGSTDPAIKAMRLLLDSQTDATKRTEIQGYIDARLAEIKPVKSVEIDVSALPEALRHLVS